MKIFLRDSGFLFIKGGRDIHATGTIALLERRIIEMKYHIISDKLSKLQ